MKNDTRYRACDGLSDKKLTTTVEADDRLEGDPFLGGASLDIIGLSGIEGSHVCLVVLRVVERHDLLRDVGLERIVVVREGGKTVSHVVRVVMERESERVMWRARTDPILSHRCLMFIIHQQERQISNTRRVLRTIH